MKIFTLSIMLAGLLSFTNAQASTINNVHIILYTPNNAGTLQFTADTARTGAPSCSTNSLNWSIDVTTAAGQTMASALLTAMATGMYVDIAGTGACQFSGLEAVGYLTVHH